MFKMKLNFIMYWIISFIIFLINESSSLKKKEIVLLRSFGTCDGHNVPNKFFNTTTEYIGRGISVMNGDMIISVPAKEVVGYFVLFKCSTSSKASCEEIMSFDVPNLCERYVEENQYYSSYTQQIKPKYQCPMVKDTHFRLRNGTFDSKTLIPLINNLPDARGSSYLMFRNIAYRKEDKLELNCIDFFLKVERLYARPKTY